MRPRASSPPRNIGLGGPRRPDTARQRDTVCSLSTAGTQQRREIAADYGTRPAAPLDHFMSAPGSAVQQHCLAVDSWATQLLAPSARWIASCLHTELLRVSRLIATEGGAAALNQVHPGVRYADGVLHGAHKAEPPWSAEVRGRLVLLPVITSEETLLVRWSPDGPLVLAYGAAGLATEPQALTETGAELCALLGRTRALVLERLGTPASTSELAGGLGLAASTVSEHLGALEAMGLVARGRTGQYVLYRRTQRARRLLALY